MFVFRYNVSFCATQPKVIMQWAIRRRIFAYITVNITAMLNENNILWKFFCERTVSKIPPIFKKIYLQKLNCRNWPEHFHRSLTHHQLEARQSHSTFNLLSSSVMVSGTLVSISLVDFCLLSSLAFVWHLGAFSWQSTCTFILQMRHFKPCRVCPEKRTVRRVCWGLWVILGGYRRIS